MPISVTARFLFRRQCSLLLSIIPFDI